MSRLDYRARIAAHNPGLGAFVDLTDETEGEGLRWGAKSNIAVKGLPYTAGCEAYRQRIATMDAPVIQRIRNSGGTVLGTVNMHEGALGATTDNLAYGRTHNPWRKGYTPGGSSGGSGAAVAAALCDVALGTDTMGSIRIPAAYCGVQGHKPTPGIVPTEGVIPLSTTLDHVGPLARDVETLWRAMHILADWGPAPALHARALAGLRIGLWDGGGAVDLTAPVRAGFEAACETIEEAGASMHAFSPHGYAYARSRRAGLLVSEIEAAKEHGVTGDGPDQAGFSKAFLELMNWGVRQPQEKRAHAYDHISAVREAAKTVWDAFDFVLAPTAPQTAFSFEADVPANQADFTAWADFASLPATALFAGIGEDGLPLSVQLIGPEGEDRVVLQVAATLEALFGAPLLPPGFET
ncbi:MAG: amidase [Pseudomonadota bacterium]